MLNRCFALSVVVLLLLIAAPVRAQTASPEALAAAKELMTVTKLSDQFRALLPTVIQGLKPAIVQGRADVERDYNAMAPHMAQAFMSRVDEMIEGIAAIYASHFSAAELRELIAFYKTPIGQKALQKMPILTQQAMVMGQRFGQSLAGEVKEKALKELRQKGHNI